MKNKITDRLSRLFLILFLFVTGYITWFTFTAMQQAPFLSQMLSVPGQVIAMGAGALLLFLLFLALLPLLRKLSARQERLLFLGILTVIFLGQLVLIFGIHQSTFMYDPYRVFDEALHMQTTHTVSGTAMEGYYAIYPNNIPFTLLCYWIVRLGAGLGLTDTGLMVLLQILNALCMDAAILLTSILLKKYVSRLSMRLFLVICLLNPLVYLWPGFIYTSTVSMPFIMGALLLFLELFHEEMPRRKNLLAVGLGVVLVLGFQIRATVLVTLIAGVIYFILGVLPHATGKDFTNNSQMYTENTRQQSSAHFHNTTDSVLCNDKTPAPPVPTTGCIATTPSEKYIPAWRKHLTSAVILLLSMAVTFSAWKGIQKQYVDFDTTDTAFPVVSWLAMGLEGDGMFNTQDYYDTKNAATAEEKKAINEEKFRTRLKNLGVSGWLDLAGRKLVRTWADGTDDYPSYLNQYSSTGKLHTWLLEDKKDFVVLFMQSMRCFLFLFTAIGAAFLLFGRKTPTGPLLLLQLNLIGGSFFHVLWETGELYSLCFSFLLFALAAAGIEEAGKRLQTDGEICSPRSILSTSCKNAPINSHCTNTPTASCESSTPLANTTATDNLSAFEQDSHTISRKSSREWIPVVFAALLLLVTAAGLLRHTGDITRTPVKRHDTLISQKTYTDAFPEGLTAGNTLTQTFVADQPFNRVAVRVKNVNADQKDSQYQITVADEYGICYMNRTVTGQDVFDYDYFYLGLDTEAAPTQTTCYSITITCIQGTADNSVAFLSYNTGNHDAYVSGALYKNGEEQEKADLNFMVYRSYEDVWMRPVAWAGICILLLAVEVGILLVLLKQYNATKAGIHT